MGRNASKASINRYYKARMEAAKYNDSLKSQEGAAFEMGIHRSTLSDYELGLTKCIPPDAVVRMAALYNAPELLYHYCSSECPIGAHTVQDEVEAHDLDRVAIKTLHSLREVEDIKEAFLEITADGVIDEGEEAILDKIIESLGAIENAAKELRIWAVKNL